MDSELAKKIVEGLKSKGTHNELLKLFEIESEDQIEGAISKLGTPTKSFKELLEDKNYQSEFDKLVTKAVQTREDKIKSEFNLVKKDDGGGNPDPQPKPNSGLEAKLDALQKRLDEQDREKRLEKRRSQVTKLLSENKMPERYSQFFDLDKDDFDLEDQFKPIKAEFEEMIKEVSGGASAGGLFPRTQAPDGNATEEEIKEITKNL